MIGPDPSDPTKVLVRRVNQLSQKTWGLEEAQVSREPGQEVPTVHSTMHRLHLWDLDSPFEAREAVMKRAFYVPPGVVSFSLFFKHTSSMKSAALAPMTKLAGA